MGRSRNPQHYDTQPLGTPAPIIWYMSLPDHVKRLYDYKSTVAQQPALMVIHAEVVCEAFTVWALEELFMMSKRNERNERTGGTTLQLCIALQNRSTVFRAVQTLQTQ